MCAFLCASACLLVRVRVHVRARAWANDSNSSMTHVNNGFQVRNNHVLERELAQLDKRIAVFIKNKGIHTGIYKYEHTKCTHTHAYIRANTCARMYTQHTHAYAHAHAPAHTHYTRKHARIHVHASTRNTHQHALQLAQARIFSYADVKPILDIS